MSFNLSKVAIATMCMFSTITLDSTARNVLSAPELDIGEASLALVSGLRWGVTKAQACAGGASYSDCYSDIEHFEIIYTPPSDNWDWDYDPFEGMDYGDPNYDNEYDAGGQGGGDGQFTASTTPLMTEHSKRDVALAVSNILTELQSLKLQLSGLISANDMAKLNRMISGAQQWLNLLNSTVQLSELVIEENYNAAFAEFGGLLAGVVVYSGVSIALGAITAPAIAAMLAGLGAYGVANMVEGHLNTLMLADIFDDLLNTSLENLLRYEDRHGDTFSESWSRFKCSYGHCTQIPPIILDLDGDGLEMTSIKASRAFMDFDNDGYYEKLSWVNGDDGILFLDLNNSGTLDQYNEFALASHAGPKMSDLDGLRTFDSNKDNLFNESDEAFFKAGVWVDKNANAKVDKGETYKLSDLGIVNLTLGKNGIHGNVGDSTYLDKMSFDMVMRTGQFVTNDAFNVVVTATYYGRRVQKLSNGVRIISQETGQKYLDLRKIKEDVSFILGADSFEGISDFSAVRTGVGNDNITISTDISSLVKAGKGNDKVSGGVGNDRVFGNAGNDELFGGNGKDTLYGNTGNDLLFGGADDDGLFGGGHDDELNGGDGNDYLHGGPGRDTFVLSSGFDTVADFNVKKDKLKVLGIAAGDAEKMIKTAKDTQHGVVITSNLGRMILLNVKSSDLTFDNFVTN
ncbi:calcium-binding protein [Rheinheimera sp. D18]|uniref:calcium-binding protein n=1 Tax=Rheinheimera sp. D18 TaxID=2545632 RepID=UPI001049FBC8|nr:calcium-binding protein [Rheinheimera sp. D18]QBL09680.1 calcium-binding protein [Rheinheimera sp. D18]